MRRICTVFICLCALLSLSGCLMTRSRGGTPTRSYPEATAAPTAAKTCWDKPCDPAAMTAELKDYAAAYGIAYDASLTADTKTTSNFTLSYGDSTTAYATGELLRDYATNLIDFYRTIDLQGLSMRCIAFGVEFTPLSSGDYGISFTFEYVHA